MERRLKMMIAGSMAVWVPVASAAEARPSVFDPAKVYRLKAAPISADHVNGSDCR